MITPSVRHLLGEVARAPLTSFSRAVIQHRITPSIRLELHSAPGDMLPVAPLALPVPPHTVRDALTLMHDSFADDRWHVSEGSDAEEGQERHEGKTIGQYISTYTVCDHISHHGPVVAGECPRCCSARLRSLAWDLVAETWEETGALLAFEEHLAPLGSLLDEVSDSRGTPGIVWFRSGRVERTEQ